MSLGYSAGVLVAIGWHAQRLISRRVWPRPVGTAPRAVRRSLQARRKTFGSQSLRGAQALATNISLITTAKRQGRDPLELIKTLLLRCVDTPFSDLYTPGTLPASDCS